MAEARIPENFGDTQIRVRVLDFMGLGLRMPREAWRLPSPQTLHAFLSTLLHLPYSDRGVVLRSVQSVFTRLFTSLVLLFCPPRICAFVCQPITTVWTVLPSDGMRIDYEGALSRRFHVLTYGPPWTTTSVHIHLFECP